MAITEKRTLAATLVIEYEPPKGDSAYAHIIYTLSWDDVHEVRTFDKEIFMKDKELVEVIYESVFVAVLVQPDGIKVGF